MLCLLAGCAESAYTLSGTVSVPAAMDASVDKIVYELTGDVAISGEVAPGAFTIADVPAGDYTLEIDAWHLVSIDGDAPAWQTIASANQTVVVQGPLDLGVVALHEISP